MSNDPLISTPSENSSPRGGTGVDGGGGQPLGGNSGSGSSSSSHNTPLSPQQLREQRLARFGGGGGGGGKVKSPPSMFPGKSASNPPATTTTTTTTNNATDTKHTNVTFNNNKSIDNITPPLPKKKEPPHTPEANTPISDDKNITSSSIENIYMNGNTPLKEEAAATNNTADTNKAMTAAVDLDDEDANDENLQAALALSLGLSQSKFDNLQPLPAFGDETSDDTSLFGAHTTTTTTTTTPDNLQLAAVVASTAMEIEDQQDNDVVMSNDDRKLPAIDTTTTTTTAKTAAVPPFSSSKILRTNPKHFSGRIRTWYESASPCNVLDFHHCMWEAGVTTPNDQKRWLAQGIQFKDEQDGNNANASTKNTDTSSLLAAIISGPGVWCLTQQHGGPCGVLASIQAELLKILLFGPRTVHPLSMISIDFPTHLTNEFTKAPLDMSRQKMRQALALSMGIILARCSLMPAATLQDDTTVENESNDNDNDNQSVSEATVRIVLPKHELWDTTTCLDWQHLEPWNSHDEGEGLSKNLLTYTISLNRNIPSGETALKRQKRSGEEIDNDNNNDNDFDHLVTELAHATAQFLLETNSLNWFQRPGGVLLMVMSIAFSRGIPKTQGDMDDLTAKLTSNFGHCSQELINVLLTGQAVSNVFDHTLRPSGELICRGIQSRPGIGYLTQLEAMRYLEVGGFYKTPQFPIWVIGSTSHFTVMFGDATALKESASDILLERVRRAFKRMDGGAEENGFIQNSQLGSFLQSLGLNSISEQGVRTLAALIEVNGAGIILWEDLWKHTSRLLTGASLESILDTDEEANRSTPTNPNEGISDMPALEAATNDVPLSDEEFARKLQAEWNGEVLDLTGTSVTTTATTIPTTTPEKFGRTFQLYHYNGLRGGNFKPFRVTRLSADEAIGASVSLGVSNQASHNIGGFGGELDGVLRTKWPSCKIKWPNDGPPSID